MTTSWILFLTCALCGVFFAGCAVYGQRREGTSFARSPWTVPVWAFVLCTAFGGLAFLLNSGVAETTLFEAEVPVAAAPPAVLEWDIPVEHPGAAHQLGVYPNSDRDVDAPAGVRVQLVDDLGRVLIDRTEELEPRCDQYDFCDWDGYSAEFTPASGGDLRLTVTVLTPDVPTLHVRVGDEQKTDGERIPGY